MPAEIQWNRAKIEINWNGLELKLSLNWGVIHFWVANWSEIFWPF